MTDATCYKKPHAFPTDMKLLWESLGMALQAYMPALQGLGIRRPRNKYRNVGSYLSYCKEKEEREKLPEGQECRKRRT